MRTNLKQATTHENTVAALVLNILAAKLPDPWKTGQVTCDRTWWAAEMQDKGFKVRWTKDGFVACKTWRKAIE